MIAIPVSRFWFWRLLPLVAAGACVAGISSILVYVFGNRGDAGSQIVPLLAFVLGLAGATVMSLSANRLGVFPEGFAPPTKPLKGILHPLWILPWEDVTDIEVIPRPPSPVYGRDRATVRVVSSTRRMDWLLASHALRKSFGSDRQGERFLAVLRIIGREIRQRGRPLTSEEVNTLFQETSSTVKSKESGGNAKLT